MFVTHSYLEFVKHSYVEFVTHSFEEFVTHSLIAFVTHSCVEFVTQIVRKRGGTRFCCGYKCERVGIGFGFRSGFRSDGIEVNGKSS